MQITWYGHAAFAIRGATVRGETRKVILDPYNYPGCGGYLPIDESADVVSVSHDNVRYHSDTSAIRGEFERLEALEIAGNSREVQGIRFDAALVHEDLDQGGPNAMVKFELDGITIAHQGDLGHPLVGESLEFLRGVDVLLALAGGAPTIDLAALRTLIEETRPAIVIPMHYKTDRVNLDILPVASFLELCIERCPGWPQRHPGSSSLDITRDNLPAGTEIVVLDHAR